MLNQQKSHGKMIAIGMIREMGRVGVFVGRYPFAFILAGLLLSIPGLLGFLKFELDADMNGGFVPSSAPSNKEIADQQSFFNASGKPFYMALFGSTEDNLMSYKLYSQLDSFYEKTMNMNLTIDGKEYYQFKDLCHPVCELNVQLQKLMELNWLAEVRYPVSKLFNYDINIGKHIFNRTITNGTLVGAKLMAFYYTSLITDEISRLKLVNFGDEVAKLVSEHNNNSSSRIHLILHGTTVAGAEVQRSASETMKLSVGSLLAASLCFWLFLIFSSWMREKLVFKRLFFSILALFLPVLALASGCGLLCLTGGQINVLFLMMAPITTLVFVSHVQNVFLLVGKFDSLEFEAKQNQYSRSERMGATFENICPSNLITNLGLIFGFGAARLFLPSSYADYSLALSFCLFILWILELFVLGGLLALECTPNGVPIKFYDKPKSKNRLSIAYTFSVNIKKFIVQPYSLILGSIPGRLIGILLLILCAALPCQFGIRNICSNMDFRRFLPSDSSANKGFDVMDTIWKDFHQVIFIINKPSNFSDYAEYMEFRKFISDVQAIPNALDGDSHMSWIFDYFKAELDIDFFSENASLQAPNMSKFNSFITTFPYKAWANGIKFEYLDKEMKMPKINRMVVMAAFNNISGLEGKRNLINACRNVAQKNPQLEITAFDTDSRTADIIENVLPTLFKWSLVILIAVTLIPLITLWNLGACLLSFVGCAYFLGTSYALIGLLGISLDLLSMTSLITVVGIGIRISLYFIGEFLLVWARDNRTTCALHNCGGNVLKTTFLTVLVVVPILVQGILPLFVQYAYTTILILGVSLLISFFVIPLIGDLLPMRMISLDTCC